MKSAFDAIAFWLIDYYIAATIVLIVVMLAQRAIGQPARRLALHWGGLVGLALLVFLCALPGWPRIDIKLLAQAVPQSTDTSHLIKIHDTKSKIEADESESEDRGTAASTLPISTAGQPLSSKSTPHGLSVPAVKPAYQTLTDRERSELSKAATVVATPIESAGLFGRLASRDFWVMRAFALAFFTLGSILTLFRVVHGLLAARSVRLSASRAPRRIVAELEKLAGEERCPELLISESHPIPIVTGTLKPRILLPPQFAERERPDDCRSVLAHELAHIQNGDLWLLALDRWLLPLFWMHPLYLRMRRRFREDQELLADTYAARHSSRTDYADMLVRWARRLLAEKQARQLSAAMGVWDRPTSLAERISRLLQHNQRLELCCSRRWRMGSLLSLIALPVLLSTATVRPDAVAPSSILSGVASQSATLCKSGCYCSVRHSRACPSAQDRIQYLLEQPEIVEVERLGGSVKRDAIRLRSFVTEVNMVFHYTNDGHRVENSNFTEEAVPHIATFRHLRTLALAGGQATDAGLRRLSGLKDLEELVLRDARRISCWGVEELVKLPLRRLELKNAPLGDAAFARLVELQTLEELSVEGGNLSVAAIDVAARLPNLRSLSLDLGNHAIGREAVLSLRALPNLKRLSLRCSKISDDAVLEIKSLTNLRFLALGDSRVHLAALESVCRARPNLAVQTAQQTLRTQLADWQSEGADDPNQVLSTVRKFASLVGKSRSRAAQLLACRAEDAQYKVFSLRIYPSLSNVDWKLAFVDSQAALAVSSEFSNHFGATLVFTCQLRRVGERWKIEEIGTTSVRDGVEKTVERFASANPTAQATDEWLAIPANVR